MIEKCSSLKGHSRSDYSQVVDLVKVLMRPSVATAKKVTLCLSFRTMVYHYPYFQCAYL